jgi:hypothetical protein
MKEGRSMATNRFTSRLTASDDYKREVLIRKIEEAVEKMTLGELDALSYDMFTKGYIEDL